MACSVDFECSLIDLGFNFEDNESPECEHGLKDGRFIWYVQEDYDRKMGHRVLSRDLTWWKHEMCLKCAPQDWAELSCGGCYSNTRVYHVDEKGRDTLYVDSGLGAHDLDPNEVIYQSAIDVGDIVLFVGDIHELNRYTVERFEGKDEQRIATIKCLYGANGEYKVSVSELAKTDETREALMEEYKRIRSWW